ncbi:unnamed protein product [Chrysoparadoxa australica]
MAREGLYLGKAPDQLTANELEFCAEDEFIVIEPKMPLNKLHLMVGDIGPAMAQLSTTVPLWLALCLKKRGRAKLSCPGWLSAEGLEATLQAERASADQLSPLPYHYLEMASLILNNAAEDVPNADTVRRLLEDIENIRREKLLKGIEKTVQNDLRAKVVRIANASAIELLPVRGFFSEAASAVYGLAGGMSESTAESQSQSQAAKQPRSRLRRFRNT